MIGLGLIEAVPEADILALADPDDARRRRHQRPAEHRLVGRPTTGRCSAASAGRPAQPTIRDQAASAFAGDIGISTTLHPDGWGDCTAAQAACRAPAGGGAPEAERRPVLDLVTFYSRNLAVPARRDPATRRCCAASGVLRCRLRRPATRPKFVTDRLAGQPEQSFQLIWPYTDLLLHDMGEGLADGRPEGRATGTEWRTAPLWGIGLTGTVTGQTSFLHDGRARSLHRGDPLARRRGAGRPRQRGAIAQGRSRGSDPLPGVAMRRACSPPLLALAAAAGGGGDRPRRDRRSAR